MNQDKHERSMGVNKILFSVFAVLSLIAAGYHFTGLFYKINDSPLWRHATFVVVDLFCVYGFLQRPNYFVYFFCVFTLQQYYSHGHHLIRLWTIEHKIHWISLFVLILLPMGLFFLFKEHRSKSKNLNKKDLN